MTTGWKTQKLKFFWCSAFILFSELSQYKSLNLNKSLNFCIFATRVVHAIQAYQKHLSFCTIRNKETKKT